MPDPTLDHVVLEVGEKAVGVKPDDARYVGLEHIVPGSPTIVGTEPAAFSDGTNSVFAPGDILFGKLRPYLRKSVRVDFPGYCSTDLLVLRARPGIDERFAAHLLRSEDVFRYAEVNSFGTKMPRTSWSALRRVRVLLPKAEEQRRIAEILDTIDDAIQATECLIAKLRHVRDGLEQDTFGREHWLGCLTTTRLGNLLASPPKNGHSPVESSHWQGGWLLGLGCLTTEGFTARQLKFAPASDNRLEAARLNDGDLLMSRSNTRDMVGLVGRFSAVGAPAFYPDLMMRLSPSSEINSDYLEAALRSKPARRQIEAMASGTSGSMVKINGAVVMSLVVPCPTRSEQNAAVSRLASASNRISAELDAVEKLRGLRFGLATDLLSGRVRTVAS